MSGKQKLELNWIGKDHRPRLEPRVLVEESSLSYNPSTNVAGAVYDNLLINGDNLLALKALESGYFGKVRCIYIDPPFNTGQAFEHYDDGIEHSLWLSLMRDRLEILSRLLSPDGSIWVHCDDNEQAYLKVMMDEVFGRSAFLATIVWQSRYSRSNDASLSLSHNFILVYSRNPILWKSVRNRLDRTEAQAEQYSNPDSDPRGPWRAIPWDAPNIRANLSYKITTPTGRIRLPPSGRCWSRTQDQWDEIVASGRAYFGRSGDGAPSFKQYLSDASGIVPNTWWPHEEAGHTDEAKKESQLLFGKDEVFSTPKPERLLKRIISIATNPGDIVLDSFAGSGTTGAVAHKMGRRWIMVEIGQHAYTHILPRMRKVVDGADTAGVTPACSWAGGGGFRFLRLAPSLLERDGWGNWIVSKEYNAAMLAEAMCKHMAFTYHPSQEPLEYWNHGFSSERDFIYVTTQALTHSMLKALSQDVGPDRHLLICCKAFSGRTDQFTNLSVRRIPQAVLANCEWGRDDYSLRIANLPTAARADDEGPPPEQKAHSKGARRKSVPNTAPDLFGQPAKTEA